MKISVIVCTYNRSESLAATLESLAPQILSASTEFQVLVVDNNSKDRTKDVVSQFCQQHPAQFRYLFEAQQGKSYALNRGIREADGDVLVFTDDDVTADAKWLQNLTNALLSGDWAGAGGRTLPERGFVPPDWLPSDMRYALAPLAIYDLGPEPRELTDTPFGNNMAFRRSVFEKHGGFRTDLGPRAGASCPQKSEDSEFGTRVMEAGGRFVYEPSAIIYHSVPKSRMQKKYFQEWWFDKARADIQAFGVSPDVRWSVAGVPLYLIRRFLMSVLRWMFTFQTSKRFARKVQVWSKMGEILECHRQFLALKMKKECDAQA
jgi:glucosyl-dolichyl phosphate glucuronosyltransferase